MCAPYTPLRAADTVCSHVTRVTQKEVIIHATEQENEVNSQELA